MLSAAKDAIAEIMQKYPAPYRLMVSGGIDSQAMLWAWHNYGKDFIPTSFTYNNTLNSHDIATLDQFSEQHTISVSKHNLDLIKFYRTDYTEYVEKYRCGSPHICTYMKMADSLPDTGTVIFSGEPLYTRGFVDRNNWGLYRYSVNGRKNVIPFFFLSTPDLAYSPEIKGISASNKVEMYNKHGFPVIAQGNVANQDCKYTGFEKVKEIYDAKYAHEVTPLDKRMRISRQRSNRVYDLLLRNKYEYQFRNDLYEYNYRSQNEKLS